MLIKLNPPLAKLLIASSEKKGHRRQKSYSYLERKIKDGKWDEIDPIWVTPNYFLNGLFHFTIKPLIIYNGHHRLEKSIEHSLPIRAYVRLTPGNPPLPEKEKISYGKDFDFLR